jgi:hypothetical protein
MRRTVHSVLRLLFIHRWAFLVPFCAAATLMFLSSLTYPRSYTAQTTFERRDDMLMANLPLTEGTGAFNFFRSTMEKDLLAPEVLNEAVGLLSSAARWPRLADGTLTPAGARMRNADARLHGSCVDVFVKTPNPHADFVTLTYRGSDVETGKLLLNAVKSAYIRRTMTRIKESLESQKEFFEFEAKVAFQEMVEARRRETDLLLAHPNINPLEPGWLTAKLTQIEIERRFLEFRRREIEAELSSESQLLATTLPEVDPPAPETTTGQDADEVATVPFDPRGDELRKQIFAAETELASLRASRGMTELHPEVVQRRNRIRSLEEELQLRMDPGAAATAPQRGAGDGARRQRATAAAAIVHDPEVLRRRAERIRAEIRIGTLRTRLSETDLELEASETTLRDLEEARKDLHSIQEAYALARAEVRNAEELHQQQRIKLRSLEPAIAAIEKGKHISFHADQPARGSFIPVSPKTATIFILALVAGIGAGVGFVILAELFDHVYRSTGAASRSLGLPILETIDEIITATDRRRVMLRHLVVAPALSVLLLAATGASASLAYLSLERPWAYDRIRAIPSRVGAFFAEHSAEPPPLSGGADNASG